MLGLAVVLAACSDSPTDNEAPAYTFDMAVTGDLTKTLRGPAMFGADTDENGDPVFGILLGQETSSHVLVLGKPGAERPAVGTYNFAIPGTAGAWNAALLIADGEELVGVLASTEGRIIIKESTSTLLRGVVELTAVGFLDGELAEQKEVVVKGTFTAKPGTTSSLMRY